MTKPQYFSFTNPIVEPDFKTNLPPIFTGFPLPYIHMDDRRFEELIYSLFKNRIDRDNAFSEKHDRIQLMQGVSEKGRDCALFSGKVFSGIIQCKKYKKALDRPACLMEIIKPLLHAVIGNLIISKPARFEYYLVVINGISNPANDMLGDLCSYIEKCPGDVADSVAHLKKEYKAFAQVEYDKVSEKLIGILKEIKVITFQQVDIEKEINEPGSESIKSVFFKIESVTNNRLIEKLHEEFFRDRAVLLEDVMKNFETGSLQLSNYRSSFETLSGSHIPRIETTQIMQWISSPLDEKNEPVLLLVGTPGDGKTVILKDVLLELKTRNMPVIALKADRYPISSLADLQAKANLPASLEACLYRVLEVEEVVTVIIDQLDAVAQSVTSERTCIDIYNQLVHTISKINGVRVVISIRKFELEYDTEFSDYGKYRKVTVTELQPNQIAGILRRLGIRSELISESLYKLLSNANNLNVFCRICKDANNPTDLLSLHDLYGELWNQLVKKYSGEKANLESSIFELATKINSEHSLTLPANSISDREIVEYLIRSGILFEAGGIQFFHQTFYDYAFAKSFMKKGRTVYQYLLDEHQTIYTRPSLKMILGFLRQKDQNEYGVILKKLLLSRRIRWHLKLLILSILGFEEVPSESEVSLIKSCIISNDKLLVPFLEAARGKSWLNILIKSGVMDRIIFPVPSFSERISSNNFIQQLKVKRSIPITWFKASFVGRKQDLINTCYCFLRSNLPHNRRIVLDYINNIAEFERKPDFIAKLLLSLKVWDNEIAKKLFEKYIGNISPPTYIKFSLLEQAASYDPKWVITQVKDAILGLSENDDVFIDDTTDHYIETISKKVIEKEPEAYFLFCLEAVRRSANLDINYHGESSRVQRDSAFEYYDHEYPGHIGGKGLYMSMSIFAAEALCLIGDPAYGKFIKETQNEKSETVIRIALVSLLAAPENFKDAALQLLTWVISIDVLPETKLYSPARKLLNKLFPLLTNSEKADLLTQIVSIGYKHEGWVYDHENKRQFYTKYGRGNFGLLLEIEESEIAKNVSIKEKYLELKRRYKTVEDNDGVSVILRSSAEPPIRQPAYSKMSLANWEKSFLKYTDDVDEDWGFEKAGVAEHAKAFEKAVKENPIFFSPLVKKNIDDNIVSFEYQLRGLKGLTEDCDILDFLPLFKTLVNNHADLDRRLGLIGLVGYFYNYPIDPWVYDFLFNNSFLESNDPVDGTSNGMIEQVKEWAIYKLMRYSREEHFAAITLNEIKNRVKSFSPKIRGAIVMQLALYLKWDRASVENVFSRIYRDDDDLDLYKKGIHLAQYLAHKSYSIVSPFLIKTMTFETCQRDSSIIVANAFLRGNKEAEMLLEKSWPTAPKTRAAMIEVALDYFKDKDDNIKAKAIDLYERFLNDTSKEVIHQYTVSFLHLKPEDFHKALPLLKKYAVSYVASQGPGYYFEYIIKCAAQNPVECLQLLQYATSYNEINITEGSYYEGSKPVKAVISCCNHLQKDFKKNKHHIDKAMDLFDDFLKDSFFREDSEKVMAGVM